MIREIVNQYEIEYPEEAERLKQFKQSLNSKAEAELLSRKNMVGHVTASGIVIWRSKSKVLMTHHVGLKHDHQPGGHFENASEHPLEVAKRHVSKALGVHPFTHFAVYPCDDVPLDIDTHTIPQREELKETNHLHFDFRYLFFLHEPTDLRDMDTAEIRWYTLVELTTRLTFRDFLIPKLLKILSEAHTRSFFD